MIHMCLWMSVKPDSMQAAVGSWKDTSLNPALDKQHSRDYPITYAPATPTLPDAIWHYGI